MSNKATKKFIKISYQVVKKMLQILIKLVVEVSKIVVSIITSVSPVIIVIVLMLCLLTFFGLNMSSDTKKEYEEYMMTIQNEYNAVTVDYYNQGNIVEGAINGKGMINWKAPLSIMQMLNGDMVFDVYEKELLEKFKNAELLQKITEESYSYEKEVKKTDENGAEVIEKEVVTENKKIVYNSSLDDYINWCKDNFYAINDYKKNKGLTVDYNQTEFSDREIEQIRILYNSNSFFDLFSEEFNKNYTYADVKIEDEEIKLIYEEFLKNVGKRYVMDHSNLSYDDEMEYFDCSSLVIHLLARTNIIQIPNTTAKGIYDNHCYPISVDERKAGDLIFLKDTYNTGIAGSISHIGIYMGTLNINGEISEWVIDTGGNPEGVKIRKYENGWWNGELFYGFGRLIK